MSRRQGTAAAAGEAGRAACAAAGAANPAPHFSRALAAAAAPAPPAADAPPEVGSIHRARVAAVRPFGAFVELPGYRKQALVHHSQVGRAAARLQQAGREAGWLAGKRAGKRHTGKPALLASSLRPRPSSQPSFQPLPATLPRLSPRPAAVPGAAPTRPPHPAGQRRGAVWAGGRRGDAGQGARILSAPRRAGARRGDRPAVDPSAGAACGGCPAEQRMARGGCARVLHAAHRALQHPAAERRGSPCPLRRSG